MKIAIIDYGGGNTQSVLNCLERLGYSGILTNDKEVIQSADRVICPGQGEAKTVMDSLQKNDLVEVLQNLKKPYLGICVGMQVLGNYSAENDTSCLGIMDFEVSKFDSKNLKIPQIGWNKINLIKSNSIQNLTESLQKFDGEYFYYANSFCANLNQNTVATTNYVQDFSTIVIQNNFVGSQFHPEKSGNIGQEFMRLFLEEFAPS